MKERVDDQAFTKDSVVCVTCVSSCAPFLMYDGHLLSCVCVYVCVCVPCLGWCVSMPTSRRLLWSRSGVWVHAKGSVLLCYPSCIVQRRSDSCVVLTSVWGFCHVLCDSLPVRHLWRFFQYMHKPVFRAAPLVQVIVKFTVKSPCM